MGNYREINHDADLGLEVSGADLADLFGTAAAGAFSLFIEEGGGGGKSDESYQLELEAPTAEDLLVSFLSELVYHFDSLGVLPQDIRIDSISEQTLKATVRGRLFNARDRLLLEIKNVTYHNLKIEPGTTGLKATIIFDV